MSTVSHSSVPHSPQATTTLTGNGVVGEARVGDVSSYYVPPQDYVQTKLPEQDQPPRSPPGHPVSMAMQEDAETAAAAAVPGPHGDRTSVIVRNHRHDDDRDEGSAELGSIHDRAAEAPSPRATAVGVSALPPDARIGGAADSATAGSEGESESWEAARKMGDEDRAASEDKDEDAAREDAKDADAASEDAEAVSEVADAEAANKDAGDASENAKDAGEYSEVASEDAEAAFKDAEAAIKSVAAAIEDAEAAGEDAKDAEVASEDGEDETAPSFEYAKNEEVANEDAEGGSENTKDEKDADAASKDAAEDAWEDVGDASEDESEDAKHANDYAKAANDDADAASSRRMREAAVATILRRTVDCVCGDELLDRLSRRHDDDPASSAGIAHHYRLAADMLSTLLRRVAASDDLATPEAARPCSVLVWRVDDGNVGALKRRHLLRAINLSAAASRRKTTATTNKRRSEAAANKPQSREEAASPREPLTTNKRRAAAVTAAEVAAAKEQDVSEPSEEQREPSPDAGGRPVRSLRPRRRVPDYRTAPAASARLQLGGGGRATHDGAALLGKIAPLRRNLIPAGGFLPAKRPELREGEDDAAASEEEERRERLAQIATAAAVVRERRAACAKSEETMRRNEDEEKWLDRCVARRDDLHGERRRARGSGVRRRPPTSLASCCPRVDDRRRGNAAAAPLHSLTSTLSLARDPGCHRGRVRRGSPEARESTQRSREESPHLAAAHVVRRPPAAGSGAARSRRPAGDESTASSARTGRLEEDSLIDRRSRATRDGGGRESRARSTAPKKARKAECSCAATLGEEGARRRRGRELPPEEKPAPRGTREAFSLATRERARRKRTALSRRRRLPAVKVSPQSRWVDRQSRRHVASIEPRAARERAWRPRGAETALV
ncbi:PREDICTED: uncharacterized protein LOC106814372 [Priapulus caudatus]|uniref:Uncharacterized protein LOC106814372 n=1 Tax=Priapulus caudatus TaxID=37621 RepID=A0ABM1EPP6_PRICU|nr:PREDICTED: uncharacterized protein LOC106814372 [Priapulus caudatus]